jgi:cyanophycin synthetase
MDSHYRHQIETLLAAANDLNIKSQVINSNGGLIKLYKDNKSFLFYQSYTPLNSALSSKLTTNKYQTHKLLLANNLPTPASFFGYTLKTLDKAINKFGFPIVAKPTLGSYGDQVFCNITSKLEATKAVSHILKFHKTFLLEPHLPGYDYRFLVLNNQVIGLIQRQPPLVTGDGITTIANLLKKNHLLEPDIPLKSYLHQQHLSLDSVLPKKQTITIRGNANFSTGGTTITIDQKDVHSDLISLAIEAAMVLKIQLSGVDILIKDLSKPRENNAVILELNSSPGFYPHHHPTKGKPQLVAHTILRYLFNL